MAVIQKRYKYIDNFDLFENYSKDSIADSSEAMRINKKFGDGSIKMLPVKKGISISITEVNYNHDLCITAFDEKSLPENQLYFYSYLSGSAEFTFEKRNLKISSGCSDIFTHSFDKNLRQKIIKNTPIKVLGILFDHDIFYEITGKTQEEIFRLTNKISKSGTMQMPVAMQRAAIQLASANIDGVDEKLFREAKILEIISYKLGQLDSFNKPENNKKRPEPKSFPEQIHYAAEILEREMIGPPGIFELAQKAGLSHNKLIQGFKEIFSSTPFGYLRQIRLKKAKNLILNENLSVTEAAFNVGYSNLSNFAKIFKKEFNINPSDLK